MSEKTSYERIEEGADNEEEEMEAERRSDWSEVSDRMKNLPFVGDEEPAVTAFVPMFKRRPVYQRDLISDCEFLPRMSYFSEQLAILQQRIEEEYFTHYRPNCGPYVTCKSFPVKEIFNAPELKGVHCLQFSPDGRNVVIGFGSGRVKIHNLKGDTIYNLKEGMVTGLPATKIRFLPTRGDVLFISSMNGSVYRYMLLPVDNGDEWFFQEYIYEKGNEINAMDINISERNIVTGGKDACLRLYDIETNKLVTKYMKFILDCKKATSALQTDVEEDEGHYLRIYAVTFHPENPNIFLSGGLDSTVKVWDIREKPSPVRNIYGPFICGDSLDVKGTTVLTGQYASSRCIQLWDLGTSRNIFNISANNRSQSRDGEFYFTTKFLKGWATQAPTADGDLVLAGGSGSDALEIISINENMVIDMIPMMHRPVVCVDSHRAKLAIGSTSGAYKIAGFLPYQDDRIVDVIKGVGVSSSHGTIYSGDSKHGDQFFFEGEEGQEGESTHEVDEMCSLRQESKVHLCGSRLCCEKELDNKD